MCNLQDDIVYLIAAESRLSAYGCVHTLLLNYNGHYIPVKVVTDTEDIDRMVVLSEAVCMAHIMRCHVPQQEEG